MRVYHKTITANNRKITVSTQPEIAINVTSLHIMPSVLKEYRQSVIKSVTQTLNEPAVSDLSASAEQEMEILSREYENSTQCGSGALLSLSRTRISGYQALIAEVGTSKVATCFGREKSCHLCQSERAASHSSICVNHYRRERSEALCRRLKNRFTIC